MTSSPPEQLTLDGKAVPHQEVVKQRERDERTALGKAWREVQRLTGKTDQKGDS